MTSTDVLIVCTAYFNGTKNFDEAIIAIEAYADQKVAEREKAATKNPPPPPVDVGGIRRSGI